MRIFYYLKGIFIPPHARKLHGRSRVIAPLILNFGARWRWVSNITLQPLRFRSRIPVPTELEVGWTHKIYALIHYQNLGQNFTPHILGLHVLGFDWIQNGLCKILRVFHTSSFLKLLIRKIASEILYHLI